jgi:Mg-chelatase subunit ChlD
MSSYLEKGGNQVARGSIYEVANTRGEKAASLLARADVIVMLDISSSMRGEKHHKACQALEDIQKTFPGRVALIEFNDYAQLNLRGIPNIPSGMTMMHLALEMGRTFDGTDTRFYLISDGAPNGCAHDDLLQIAASFTNPIHTVFIGNDWDTNGQKTLEDISSATGGTSAGRIEPKMLGKTLMGLLTGGQDDGE